MISFYKKRRSLAMQVSLFTIILVLLQSVLLVGTLISGGVLTKSKENVYQSFQDKVSGRAKFLQSEIDNRWKNIDPYVHEISSRISEANIGDGEEEKEQFLMDISSTLISMVRFTGSTGSFLILDDESGGRHSGLYFRNYDPASMSDDNSDLYLLAGPDQIGKSLGIPLDRTWHYGVALEEGSRDFYDKPYEASALSDDYSKLEYWSQPFRLTSSDEEIITYTVPLFDNRGAVRGVMGVEILTDYFKKLLPASELASQDSLGYLVASLEEEGTRLQPLISKGAYQKRVIGDEEEISVRLENSGHNIYELMGVQSDRTVYGCGQEIYFYRYHMPYETPTVLLVGLMDEEKLLVFVRLLQHIILFSFAGSLLLGGTAGVIISRRITAPVVDLAQQVRRYDYTENLNLKKTGLSEMDQLAGAIEESGRNLLETTLKMSKIMDLLHVPIGAFEDKEGSGKVLVTNQIFFILDLPHTDALSVDRKVFKDRIAEIKACPEPDEQQIFQAGVNPDKWVKIELLYQGSSTLGVIRDVTEEIREKHRIIMERDYDFLTHLYNRAAFERHVRHLLGEEIRGSYAMVMFDLDDLKKVNDTYGHECGDVYIRSAADWLSEISSTGLIAGRRSGDEFYLFFYGWESSMEIYDAIACFYQKLEKKLYFSNGTPYQIHISSGISWLGSDADSYEELVCHADFAMYEVKLMGKGCLGEFDPESYERSCKE